MADFQARREARMRRIKDSSEDRMNRVLGLSQRHGTSNDAGESLNSGVEKDNAEETKECGSKDQVVEETKSASDQGSVELRRRQVPDIRDVNKNAKSTVKVSPLKPVSKSPGTANSTYPNESLNASRGSKDAKMMLKHFEFLRIVLCFMAAFICRKVLSTGYGLFYVESVMLPFVCLEAGFFMFKHHLLHNVMLPHRSSMMVGLLMLCGIRPNILHTYNKIMGYFTAASEDFAMFLFAFMMSSLVVS